MYRYIKFEDGAIGLLQCDISNESTALLTNISKYGAQKTTRTPTEKDVSDVEKIIGSKFPTQLRKALLTYGYICKDSDEWLGLRSGIKPKDQTMCLYYKGMYSKGLELYGRGDKTDKIYYPFASNGCGDYLCVDQDNKVYEYIHDAKIPIVDFSKEYKIPECKDFDWYLNNIMLGDRDYYGE